MHLFDDKFSVLEVNRARDFGLDFPSDDRMGKLTLDFAFEETLVHPEQHICPVVRFRSSCTRVKGEDCGTSIVRARKHPAKLHFVDTLQKGLVIFFHIVEEFLRIRFGLSHFVKFRKVIARRGKLVPSADGLFERRNLFEQSLGFVLIIPKIRIAGFLFKYRELYFLRLKVKDTPGAYRFSRGVR